MHFLETPVGAIAARVFVSTSARTLAGRSLAGYTIGERVVASGMGEVYRGRDTRLGRDVAITVKRDWRIAKLWLLREMEGAERHDRGTA